MAKRDLAGLLRGLAMRLPDVEEGGSCTKAAYAARGKNFLFVGDEPDHVSVMLKLRESLAEAGELAAREPGRYKVGATGWVTARFEPTADAPLTVLERWVGESHRVLAGPAKKAPAKKTPAKKTPKAAAARRA